MAIVPSGTMVIVGMKIFATNYMKKFQHVTMDQIVLDRIVNIFMIKILETIFQGREISSDSETRISHHSGHTKEEEDIKESNTQGAGEIKA